MDPTEFVKKYLEGEERGDETRWKENVSPCPFLTEENECEIYSARPVSCRRFPIKTDFGSHFDCACIREMREAIENIANGTPHSTKPRSYDYGRDGKEIPDHLSGEPPAQERWTKIKRDYLEATSNKKAQDLFLELNNKAREQFSSESN